MVFREKLLKAFLLLEKRVLFTRDVDSTPFCLLII